MADHLYNLATDRYRGFFAGIAKLLLLVLSWVYGLIIRVISLARSRRPVKTGCVTISVGNITVGGTGKTSLVEYIWRSLDHDRHKVVILTRGYKKPRSSGRWMHNANNAYEAMGDEASMMQKDLKGALVIVDADRVRGAARAKEYYGIDTIILDDGFQQWGIEKDIEIVTIDATRPFGNFQMLPRGILREPLSALKRADVFVLTKTNINPDTAAIKERLRRINPQALIAEAAHHPCCCYALGRENEPLSPDILKEKELISFSGIADPVSFRRLLAGLGARSILDFDFDDHYRYAREDVECLLAACSQRGVSVLVTTHKDAARLRSLAASFGSMTVLVLRIELKVTFNEERLLDRLLGLYRL